MKTIDVTASVVCDGARILIARRAAHDSNGGKWEFPGGTVEPGESAEECVHRELQEELGIDVRILRFLGMAEEPRPDCVLRLLFYQVQHVQGEIRLVDHDQHAWVTLCELLDYEFPSADRRIVEQWVSEGAINPFA
ncbi:MAG: (deoxy)nucleoside triphosphate pyrophosphohydrolase [Verrucomicrobia bacterium]|nr:(deoxy)nucleoside triphosphate pyrophosphohydrolase [Verrucomicrobiota bacterium]